MADNIVPLHMTQTEVEEAWARYDAAMQQLHQAYRDQEPDPDVRMALATEALRAETTFKSVFNRAPRRITGQ